MSYTPPIAEQTPKQQFQASADNLSKHRHMLELPEYQRAVNLALLEYMQRVHKNSDLNPNAALAGFYRILGAQELIHVIFDLGVLPAKVETVPSRNLDHTA